VVASALELLRSAIPSSIEMDVRLDDSNGGVPCDAVELEQLLMNLAINARDAIVGAGRISVTLREVQLSRETCSACLGDYSGGYIELAVADTGSGIAPQTLPHIFEPFFTTKDVGKGTGLGLALVHGIVHKAGGHIQIGAAKGGGTLVQLRLPRVALKPVAGAAPGAARSNATEPQRGQGAHVMVVDDELALGRYWRDLLESEGYRVSVFDDSRAALAAFDAAPADFNAVLSDLTMPYLSGEHLARAMLQQRPTLPVFLLSGNLAGFDASAVARLGVRQCFKKPADSAEILAALDAALAAPSDLAARS
jgi:CheY-like chemotaxis protein